MCVFVFVTRKGLLRHTVQVAFLFLWLPNEKLNKKKPKENKIKCKKGNFNMVKDIEKNTIFMKRLKKNIEGEKEELKCNIFCKYRITFHK